MSYDPFKRESRKRVANRAERRLAKQQDGFRQPRSGAIAGFKGDVVVGGMLEDLKQTDKDSIRVRKKDLVKITREANESGKTPALVIEFSSIAEGVERRWLVIPITVTNSPWWAL